MKYEISTGLIYEKFGENVECPLCEIKKTVEKGIVEQFLGDAVMEDHTREEVNELGFCVRHFDLLFNRPSKLGLALQMETRVKTLNKKLSEPKNYKQALKEVNKIEEQTKTCIVCKYLNEHMNRYYKTIAKMYDNEKDFRELFAKNKGFCLEHYKELLRFSKYAGGKTKEYLELLFSLENQSLSKIIGGINWFCLKHDYRNQLKPMGEAEGVLERTRTKLFGDDKEI
ncbi:MAG: hypothetical protein E7342_00430 [Clostridiales bacterium]|nr:hypothetical protein [Clostridiales bacterium]